MRIRARICALTPASASSFVSVAGGLGCVRARGETGEAGEMGEYDGECGSFNASTDAGSSCSTGWSADDPGSLVPTPIASLECDTFALSFAFAVSMTCRFLLSTASGMLADGAPHSSCSSSITISLLQNGHVLLLHRAKQPEHISPASQQRSWRSATAPHPGIAQ